MLDSTLYADKETKITIKEINDRFCLKLSELFKYDLDIVGTRQVFENIHEVLENNLFEDISYKELSEELSNKELLLEQARSEIDGLKSRIEFLEGRA